ncbi:hypothetical protein DRN72_00695 [Methanosarcinales archaeon]|nr:MAG: hypothetical protein DRN72_00695 [Methanosarcinales archaeon]
MVRDTIIVYQNGFNDDAEKIKKYLEGAGASVKVKRWDELKDDEKKKDNLILIGDASFEPASHIFSIAQRLNLYAYIENGKVVTVNGREYDDGCVIVAVNNPWNPKGTAANENMVMVVAGTTAEEVEGGVNVLLNPDEIRYRYACVVVNGEVIPVP